MGMTETTDAGLRQLVHQHAKAFVTFTAANCALCDQLLPVLHLFATNPAYAAIAFLLLDADQNPVAKQLMQQNAAPFFVSYVAGRLVHCDNLYTEQQVRATLNALQARPAGQEPA
jgi:thioredoxin 1